MSDDEDDQVDDLYEEGEGTSKKRGRKPRTRSVEGGKGWAKDPRGGWVEWEEISPEYRERLKRSGCGPL